MRQEEIKYILVADSHLSGDDSDPAADGFFAMLDRIASFILARKKGERPALVFLGDIFELWIAVRGYENTCHERFLAWCRRYKEEFPVYFIEGNHEFFVTGKYGKDFTFCTADRIERDGTVFLHGDLINLTDWKYRSLRILLRNPFTAFLLYLFAGFGGKVVAEKIRMSLKESNLENKKYFPAAFMEQRAYSLFKDKKGILVAGHFHDKHILSSENGLQHIYTLPAWNRENGYIGFLYSDGSITVCPWHNLPDRQREFQKSPEIKEKNSNEEL